MQGRFFDYGKTYTAPQYNAARHGITATGPYRGFGLSADASDNIVIALGYGVLEDGFEWSEDGNNLISFAAYIPLGAADYTVCAVHVDRQILGGVSVTYEVRAGILTSTADGAVLGWVRYPGGAIPLATAHLQKAPNLLQTSGVPDVVLAAPETRYAPFNNQNGCFTSVPYGIDIALTTLDLDLATYEVHQLARNSPIAMAPEVMVQTMQFYAGAYRPLSFDFWLAIDTDPDTNLTVQVFDTAQAPVGAASVITGTASVWVLRTVTLNYNDLAAATFDYGKPYTLRLTHNLGVLPPLGASIKIAKITQHCWPV